MIRHFISYPKSGRTWVRYMLQQLGCERHIHIHHDRFEFNDGARPAHNFDLAERLEHYSRVDRLIYLERDPRDVMVSLYHQVTGRFRDFFGYQGSLSDFIRDDYFGAENLHRFRGIWTTITREKGFPIVHYEDLHRETTETLRQIVTYFGFLVRNDQITTATRNAEFDTMKIMEQSNNFPEPWLRPRNGFAKVRVGKVGSHVEVLSVEDLQYLNDLFTL